MSKLMEELFERFSRIPETSCEDLRRQIEEWLDEHGIEYVSVAVEDLPPSKFLLTEREVSIQLARSADAIRGTGRVG